MYHNTCMITTNFYFFVLGNSGYPEIISKHNIRDGK